MDKLLPCPFCGGEVRWCGDDPTDKHDCHQIHCDGCGAQFDYCPDHQIGAETLEELRDEVANIWNARNTVEVPVEEKYRELIMAVASKFPDETRHETALRYIKQAEEGDYGPEQAHKGE